MPLAALLTVVFLTPPTASIHLQFRVFDGPQEVTTETRIKLFKSGERQSAVAELGADQPHEADVAEGLYDAQAIHEKDGRVVSIRWAERLVVMPYPDEQGAHLEVINFHAEFGALQVRGRSDATPVAALFPVDAHQREAAQPLAGSGYLLFVVPAGAYDLRIGRGDHVAWHPAVDVPRDRTRFWVVP